MVYAVGVELVDVQVPFGAIADSTRIMGLYDSSSGLTGKL